MRRSPSERPWAAALVVTAIAVFSAGAVMGLAQLHRVTASPRPGAAAAVDGGREGAPGVLVTRDFGGGRVASGEVGTSGGTVMDALEAVADVETAYGGGFVNAVEGIASGYTGGGGVQSDWFYYVNGLLADRGAGEFRLRPGDRVWWDFHRWGGLSAPAVVGQYPEPFVHGYDGRALPTVIAYADGFAPEAEKLASAMRESGAASVRATALEPSMAPPTDAHVVLVGTFAQLSEVAWVADAALRPGESGLLATFSAERSAVLDAAGKIADSPAAGAVLATSRGDTPGVAIWLVTGSTEVDTRTAAKLLAERPAELTGRFGVLVGRDGTVTPLPLVVER